MTITAETVARTLRYLDATTPRAVESRGRVIVGLPTGDSDEPGVVEDLALVVIFEADDTAGPMLPALGSCPLVEADDAAYYVVQWADRLDALGRRWADEASTLADAAAAIDRLTDGL